MLLFINLLLLVPLICASLVAYFHFFGGPLAHHYLYVRGPGCAPTEGGAADSNCSNTTSGSMPFGPKNNRSAGVTTLLHRVRTLLMGVDESAKRMIVFRALQQRVWRLYKLLLRRIVKTGELERIILESSINMVPMGSCTTERVGFHPHLVSLAVRISAYLRTSEQLKDVLKMESESSAAEVIAASVVRSSPVGKVDAQSEMLPGDSDVDETPMSTPLFTGKRAGASSGDPPTFTLGAAAGGAIGSALSPKTFSPIKIDATSPSSTSSSGAFSPLSSTSSSALPSFTPSNSMPLPPTLSLSALGPVPDETCSLELQDQRANHLLQLIVAIKHVSRTSGHAYSNLFRPVLYRSIIFRNEVEDFLRFQLEPTLAIKYDQTNAAHERWLQELWELYLPLGPSRPRPAGRITKEWGSLGFQGDNPATDFRGMGVLGLRNLCEFARLCPIQANLIMKHSQEHGLAWFGMAITGINLTADLVKLAQTHVLDAYFYTYGANWNAWHALYATMFSRFDEFWQEARPANVMSYSSVHSAFLSSFVAEAICFPFSPRALASSTFDISSITPVTPHTLLDDASDSEDASDSDSDFDIEGVTEVTEGRVSRRASKSSAWALSRSTSPFSTSGRSSSHPSSPNSNNSPSLVALSRSEFLESGGGVIPLGNALDPITVPALFARHPLPPWQAI